MAVTQVIASGSVDGQQIPITGTSSGAANTIHTAAASPTVDNVWIYATNPTGADITLTIMFGGTTSTDDYKIVSVPTKDGEHLLIPGFPLTNGKAVKAFGSAAGVNVTCFVHRIT